MMGNSQKGSDRMEEKNITNQPNEKKSSAPHAETKKKDKDTFADYKAEFKKIIWPSRPETVKKTATVVVVSLMIGVVIFCMDTVLSAGYGSIISLIG